MKPSFCVLAFALMAAPAFAQTDAGTSMPTRADLQAPSSCAAWAHETLLAETLLASADAAKAPDVKVGQAYALHLSPVAEVGYPVAPKPDVTAGSHGGLLALTVEKAGTYSFAVDGPARVSIVKDGAVVEAVSTARGNDCGQATAFKLDPGLYSIQIYDAASADIRLAISAR